MIFGQFKEYKGYVGTIEYSTDDFVYHGKLLNIKDLVSYEGNSFIELYRDYLCAINDYIEIEKELSGLYEY